MTLRLMVSGDPILDVWSYGYRTIEGGRWVVERTETRQGGAANTYANAHAIGRGLVYAWDNMPYARHELIRFMDCDDDKLFMDFWNHYGDPTKMYRLAANNLNPKWSRNELYGLVASEYNKGTMNRLTKRNIPPLEFAVIDSRHRTMHMSWLETAKIKIWHATGSEFDATWAKNFDYIIHTNGPNEVFISFDKQRAITILPVPDTEVVDTIGAGDTLTAALGVFLARVIDTGHPITHNSVVEATRFAIWCCQDVITKPLTAICTRTLEEYLNVHNEHGRDHTST